MRTQISKEAHTKEYMIPKETPPSYIWRWLGLTAVLLLLLSVAAIALISAGTLDPRPAGTPVARYSLGLEDIAGGKMRHQWVAEVPTRDYTARLNAAYDRGELDSGFGLIVGGESDYLVAAVSPLGYATVWQQRGLQQTMLFPWQPWPHVETGTGANEIQVSVSAGTVSVRINRELLWEGIANSQGNNVGTFLQSFGEPTVVDFQTLTLYQLPDTK